MRDGEQAIYDYSLNGNPVVLYILCCGSSSITDSLSDSIFSGNNPICDHLG